MAEKKLIFFAAVTWPVVHALRAAHTARYSWIVLHVFSHGVQPLSCMVLCFVALHS
jgi:hypothetical protein